MQRSLPFRRSVTQTPSIKSRSHLPSAIFFSDSEMRAKWTRQYSRGRVGKKHFSHVYITQTSHRGSYYESREKGGRTTRQSYSSPDRLRSPNLLREISHYLPLEEAPRRRRRRRRSRRHAHEFGHGRFRERFSRFTQPTRPRTASTRSANPPFAG